MPFVFKISNIDMYKNTGQYKTKIYKMDLEK